MEQVNKTLDELLCPPDLTGKTILDKNESPIHSIQLEDNLSEQKSQDSKEEQENMSTEEVPENLTMIKLENDSVNMAVLDINEEAVNLKVVTSADLHDSLDVTKVCFLCLLN